MTGHVQWAVATWPQIDPDVEGIVSRIDRAHRDLQSAFRATIGQVGLTKEEWKVVMALHGGSRSHGSLCRELDVSTGVMTGRLDKLEHRGLITRAPDPADRRGVLLDLTSAGRERLEHYIDVGAARERELLGALTATERRELNELLSKLLVSLDRRSGSERTANRGPTERQET